MPPPFRARNHQTPFIADYGLIGDCRAAALVSRGGSIDWMCWPRFDSPAVFAGLLDAERGGTFAIAPAGFDSSRHFYEAGTNVLVTEWTGPRGSGRLIDCFVAASEREKLGRLWPDHELLRIVECTDGEIEVEARFDPRLDYGSRIPAIRGRGPKRHLVSAGRQTVLLHTDFPLRREDASPGLIGRQSLARGERSFFSLTLTEMCPQIILPLGGPALERLALTREYWQRWSGAIRYEGPYRDAVVRSALALKLLAYAPSGAIIAAPTASLPEEIGGVRNWDYRFCWLRDAAMTLRALLALGHEAEAVAFFGWLMHATRRHRPRLRPLFDIHGGAKVRERRLDHLRGYRDSRPVRIGNAAATQLQLDIYGVVVQSAHEYVQRGHRLDRDSARFLRGIGRFICRHWREPDAGIWELRGEPRRHTLAGAMCAVALERLLQLHAAGSLRSLPKPQFERALAEIRRVVRAEGYRDDPPGYVAELDGAHVDASLLLLPIYGFEDPASPRARATHARIERELGAGGLLYRYRVTEKDDALPGEEGAFALCSLWEVQYLARAGRMTEARECFDGLLARANDLGLYSEEIDPFTGEYLGNYPQAYTHVGVINAAIDLAAAGEASSQSARNAGARLENAA